MRVPSRLAVAAVALGAAAACGDRGASTVAAAPQAAPPASVGAATSAPSPAPALARDLQAIVDRFRKIVVLVEDQSGFDTAARGQADMVGRLLFQENHQAMTALAGRLLASPAAVGTFLDDLERSAELHDADKLAFRDVMDDLLVAAREGKPVGASALAGLRGRLEEDDAALREIQKLYEKELEKVFGRFETRGMAVRREAWESYVAFLKTRLSARAVLAESKVDAEMVAHPRTEVAGAAGPLEIVGSRLPLQSLVLTFDDGPHPRHTERILEILTKFGVKAVFFEVGQNLGTLKDGKVVPLGHSAEASKRLLEAGYALANHSYTHAFLPKLSDEEIAREIELTSRMLRDVDDTQSILFRAPYGARNPKVMAAIQAHGLRSILWNIDSRDWADPVPASIANRAIAAVEAEHRGIILFHDIQARTVEALPLVLETLQARGYRFLAWNGTDFVPDVAKAARGETAVPVPAPAERNGPRSFYRESWAVVIGIDAYKNWPKLSYAANDARAVQDLLVRRYHFKPENVTLLLNEEATRDRILSTLGDQLADGAKVKKDDRVFVFFAGHGATRHLPTGRALGYIIPVEADATNYQGQAISMTNFQDISEAIPAKHVLFVTDACYSGIALTRGGGGRPGGQNYLEEVTRRTVRQMLTAGGADEEVADNGPSGHSIFTWALTQGLDGRADLNGDGFITGSELATYVAPTVSSLSKQTPAFGNLVGSEGGDFVFELKHDDEFLSEVSDQLDEEAIRLNAELDRIKAQIAEKRARNVALQKQVVAARTQLAGDGTVPAAPGGGPPTESGHIDRGTTLFREKKYAEALDEFREAAKMSPSSALAANNVGFTYYKLDRFEEAATWFEKTIALDPKRAIAYANLGDADLRLGRTAEARRMYESYLQMQPGAAYADTVRKRLEEMGAR